MAGRWFGTQGGGKAVECSGWYVWAEPPKDFPSLHIGDPVPAEWGICGPFDDDGKQIDTEGSCYDP
jgi:hypothetical protein